MDSGDWSNSVAQSDAWTTYHCAEALAEADHGMTFVGGIGGSWTMPTSGNSSEAATLMHIAADCRAQSAAHHGGNPDAGHLSSFIAAHDAAWQITHSLSSSNQSASTNYGGNYGGGSSIQSPAQDFGHINWLQSTATNNKNTIKEIENTIANTYDDKERDRLYKHKWETEHKGRDIDEQISKHYANQRY